MILGEGILGDDVLGGDEGEGEDGSWVLDAESGSFSFNPSSATLLFSELPETEEPDLSGVEYFDTFAPFGSLGAPGDPWVIGISLGTVAFRAHLGKDLLVIAEPLEVAVVGNVDLDLFPPFGSLPDDWSSSGLERSELYIACSFGRSTKNDDIPPAQYVPGKLMPFNFGARLFDGLDPAARSTNEGVISLIDPDGGLNDLIGRNWDSTPITIKRGGRKELFKNWEVVGRYRSAGLVRDMDQKQIQLRNPASILEGPLHGETYAGSGGVEGTGTNITGRRKPWALGYNFNIEPVLLSTADQIFQWSLTSSQELTEFRHGGAVIPIDADYPTYAALAAAVIPSGECATCLADSLVRPNITLQFGVRVDVIGDADVVEGHPTPLTRAAIVRRILTSRGENVLDDNEDLDLTSFNAMEAFHSAPVGWYFDGEFSKAQAIDIVLKGILGWWRVRPNGLFTIGWLVAPESLPATITFTEVEDVGKPRLVKTQQPRRGTRVSWRWNWAPQPDRASLAGSVSDDDALLYARPTSYGQSLSAAVASTHPTSQLVSMDMAGFRDEEDAAAEADRQMSIYGVERNRWARDLQIDPFADILGAGVRFEQDPIDASGSTQMLVAIEATGSSVQTVEFIT